MHRSIAIVLSLLTALVLVDRPAVAQQVRTGVSNNAVSDGYFERMGVHWGLRFRQGSFNLALPPFGGYAPGAGITGGAGPLGFEFSQGSRRSFTSQSLSVVTPNGVPGYVADSSWTPFVIGTVPVVGGFPLIGSVVPPTPAAAGTSMGNPAVQQALQQARTQSPATAGGAGVRAHGGGIAGGGAAAGGVQNRQANGPLDPEARLAAARTSSAGRAVASVAAAKQAREAERVKEAAMAREYMERGQEAERAGKRVVAKINYQIAARHAEGELKAAALARLNALTAAASESATEGDVGPP